MAVGAAAANFIGFGVLFGFGLFFTPLATEFSTTTGPVAPLFSLSVLCYYLANALGGLLADRRGPAPVVAFGAVALPAGLVLSSTATALWQVYLFYVPLVGLAVGSCYASLIGAVGRRFVGRRALAIAVVLTGVGAGTLVLPLAVRFLLDAYRWRSTLQILGVAALVILTGTAVAAHRARTAPAPGNHESSVTAALRAGTAAVFRSAPFRRLYTSVVLIAPGFYAPLAFLNDDAVSRGIGPGSAALLLSIIGLCSASSRIAFGASAQRLGPLRQYRLSHLGFLAALLLWLASGPSYPTLVVVAAVHGLAWAAWVTAAPLVLADWFGVDDLGFLVGVFYTGLGFGAVIGPALSGFVIDAAGYRAAVGVVSSIAAVSVLLLFSPVLRAPVSETRN